MAATTSRDSVAKSLRPVVLIVVASKMAIISFLFASIAGIIPAPATADQTAAVYITGE